MRRRGRKGRAMKRSSETPGWARYLAGGLCLAALVAAALLLPQILFESQDRALCREMILEGGENVSLNLIDSSYEMSLCGRLEKFAAGIAQGRAYYVSEQEMEVTEKVREKLETAVFDTTENQYPVFWVFMNASYLPLAYLDFDYTLADTMKQYVIYTDDYKEGVNFILWCVTLRQHLGGQDYTLTLLLDAKTMSLYGFQTDGETPATLNEYWREDRYGNKYYQLDNGWPYRYTSLEGYNQDMGIGATELWAFLGCYYQEVMGTDPNWGYDMENILESMLQQAEQWELEGWEPFEWQDENTLLLSYLFDQDSLHWKLHIWDVGTGQDVAKEKDVSRQAAGEKAVTDAGYRYPGICFELSELCRLIPEFSAAE